MCSAFFGRRGNQPRATKSEAAGLDGWVRVLPLYGELTGAAQDAALAPAPPGQRKIVLATTIAETSLTIEGIRVVVDSGLRRYAEFDPATGMSRLVTAKVSQAAADQRRGRAGRISAGLCYRLWSEGTQASLSAQTEPEMAHADLAPLALELSCWGAADATGLRWLDPPPAAPLAQARDLLQRLEAIDGAGRVTAHGRALARVGAHPRLAHMLVKSRAMGALRLACDLAAILSERDILRAVPGARDADLRVTGRCFARRHALAGGHHGRRRRIVSSITQFGTVAARFGTRVAKVSRRYEGLLPCAPPTRITPPGCSWPWRTRTASAALVAGLAAARRETVEGRTVTADIFSPTAAARASPNRRPYPNRNSSWPRKLDGAEREARIFLAAPLVLEDIETLFGEHLVDDTQIVWDDRTQAVRARRERRLGAHGAGVERPSQPRSGCDAGSGSHGPCGNWGSRCCRGPRISSSGARASRSCANSRCPRPTPGPT